MDIAAISGINPLASIGSISPIGSIGSIADSSTAGSVSAPDGTSMFSDLYNGLINNVNDTNTAFEGDIVKAAEGELDNPHQLTIDSTKANIAFQLMSSVRTQALEAYNDVIKMSV